MHHSSVSSGIWNISCLIQHYVIQQYYSSSSQHHLNSQFDQNAINILIGVIDRILELEQS